MLLHANFIRRFLAAEVTYLRSKHSEKVLQSGSEPTTYKVTPER